MRRLSLFGPSWWICLLVQGAWGIPATAQEPADPVATTYEDAIQEARQDIESVKRRLAERRKVIADERVTLSRDVSRLTAEVSELRRRLREQERERGRLEAELGTLTSEASRTKGSIELVTSQLDEALRETRTKLDSVDLVRFEETLEELRETLGSSADGNEAALGDLSRRILGFLADRVDDAGRIRIEPGVAIGPDGRELEGAFVRIGAVLSLFAAPTQPPTAGHVERRHGGRHVHFWPVVDTEAAARILRSSRGEESLVPIDVSSGAAFRFDEGQPSLIEQLRAGGVVVIPILAIALICFIAAVAKTLQLLLTPVGFDGQVAHVLGLLSEGKAEEARAFADRSRRPIRRVLQEGIAHRESSREDLDDLLHEAILVEVPRLEKHLVFLSIGAVVSPLLGLLGTVTGMIHTFRLIEIFGSGDAKLLSGGISEALVTTMAGLSVAIPLVLLHALLSRRVRTIGDGLEKSAVTFINHLKSRVDLPAVHVDPRGPEEASP